MNHQVLGICLGGMGFGGLELDDALRTMLRQFRLPGEPEKIDRIMQRFADRFVEANKFGSIAKPDVAYVLVSAGWRGGWRGRCFRSPIPTSLPLPSL